MDKTPRPDVAEMQRLFDLIATTASKLKTRIETVQCMAIDIRLTLMAGEADHHRNRVMQARQQIAHELGSLADDIKALKTQIRSASVTTEHRTLQ